jgi:L-ribulose-5-phosphate 3-epimerase
MKNPIAATTGGYPGSSLERVLLGLSRAGFRSVELFAIPGPDPRLPVERMSRGDVADLRSALAAHGLAPVSVSAHSDLASAEGVRAFTTRIAFARALDVDIVNTGTTHGDSPVEAERFFANMRQIVPVARENGVRIALETHGGLTGTAADCRRTLERLGSEQVGINYDTANVIYYRGVRPEEDVRAIADRVIHVHLKDKRGGRLVEDFPPLGQGTIDFRAVLAVLREADYRGPISAEVELRASSADDEDRLMARTREFMEDLLGADGRPRG